jgi:hypothetical protein
MLVHYNNYGKSSITVKHTRHTVSVPYSIRNPNWLLHYMRSEFIQFFMTTICCYSWNDMLKRIELSANYNMNNNRYKIQILAKARYTRCKFCIQVSIQVFWSCIPYKKLESKNLNGLGWNGNASYLFSTWMELGWRLTNQKTESLSASICECK